MRFILCLDDNNGMLFNNRRQSRDRVLISDVINGLDNEKLYINNFSQELFKDYNDFVCVVDKPQKNMLFFAENIDVNEFCGEISQVTVYKWNRVYPADFLCELDFSQFTLVEEGELMGSSHEKITKLVYEKK